MKGRAQEASLADPSKFQAVPVQKVAHFLSLSYAHGARTFSQMRHTVQRSLFPSMAVLLFLGAGSLAFAQIFLPQRTWPRFFQHMSFLISTLDNVFAKRVIRTAERRDEMREERREERREAQRRVETRGKKRETQRRADTDEREGGGMESSPSSVETTRARPRKPA